MSDSCDPMDCSLAGSSVHGISQARIWLYKSEFIGKDPDAGKDWGQEVTKDEMIGWHHWLNGHESEQTPGDSEGQGSLTWCSPWGGKELMQLRDWTKTSATYNISKGQFSSLLVSPSPVFCFVLNCCCSQHWTSVATHWKCWWENQATLLLLLLLLSRFNHVRLCMTP